MSVKYQREEVFQVGKKFEEIQDETFEITTIYFGQ